MPILCGIDKGKEMPSGKKDEKTIKI